MSLWSYGSDLSCLGRQSDIMEAAERESLTALTQMPARLLRSVASSQFVRVAAGGAHALAVTADDADGAAHADGLATTAAATHNMGTTPNSCPADDAGARIRREENQDQQSLTPTRAAVPCQSRCHRTGVDRGAWATGQPNPTSLCGNTSNSGVIRPHTLFASRLIGDVCAAPMRCCRRRT